MITVSDVPASSKWYQDLMGATSGHGGAEFEMLMHDGELMLMLHHAGTDHHHPTSDAEGSVGNGVALYFRVGERFAATVAQAKSMDTHIIQGPTFNELAHQDELWVRDPDGYTVVLAGPAPWAS